MQSVHCAKCTELQCESDALCVSHCVHCSVCQMREGRATAASRGQPCISSLHHAEDDGYGDGLDGDDHDDDYHDDKHVWS